MNFKTMKENGIMDIRYENSILDASNSDEFKNDILRVIAENKKIALDLSEVSFVDSSGCGALLFCLRNLAAKECELKLYGVQQPVRLLFELVRMHRVVDILNTREEVLQLF
ncbi:MAG: anti-anti-sigma factor [Desulfotalea sp.]|nr:MAG: anti-anti-sigma factor [Desulfotalea sp.]